MEQNLDAICKHIINNTNVYEKPQLAYCQLFLPSRGGKWVDLLGDG